MSFFRRRGDGRFEPSELTRGPWDPDSQHAGPPAAADRPGDRAPRGRRGQAGGTGDVRDPAAGADRPAAVEVRTVRPGPQRRAAGGRAERCRRPRAGPRDSAWRLVTGEVDLGTAAPVDEPLCPGPTRPRTSATSFPPARTSATTRRWSTASSPAASWRWARRSGVDADAPPAGGRRGADPAPARAGGGRLGQRCQRRARLAQLPVHQHRPQRAPAPDARRPSGSASTRSPGRKPTASACRTRCCSTSAGRSAGRPRRCSYGNGCRAPPRGVSARA